MFTKIHEKLSIYVYAFTYVHRTLRIIKIIDIKIPTRYQ